MYGKLFPYLWSKLTYYNQLGKEVYKLLAFGKNVHGFCYIDILLIGDSRTGKSTFINLVSQKLTSLELQGTNSVTNKILTYEVYMDDILKKYIGNCPGGLRFTDTLRLVNKKCYEMVKKEVKLDKIDIIYFFTNESSNLENSLEMLKYIDKTNNKRIKCGLKKIPIIFIINGEDKSLDLSINASDNIKKFLFDNNLKNLYNEEKVENSQNDQKINRIQALKEK